MPSPSDARVIAIFGPPGAGKTTVARAVAAKLHRPIISSGDIARQLDPGALARGEMADRVVLRAGFLTELAKHADHGVVVDGLPRDPTDVELLPADTLYILLNCRPDVAVGRQVLRGRPGDTIENIVKRTSEQRALMELDKKGGWSYELATWKGALDTTALTVPRVITQVTEYLAGERKTIC